MKNQLLGIFLIVTLLLGTNAWAQDIDVPRVKKRSLLSLLQTGADLAVAGVGNGLIA